MQEFYSLNVYPTLFTGKISITFYSTIDNTVNITIYNTLGDKIKEEVFNVNEGYNEIIQDNLGTLVPGIYMVNVRSAKSSLVRKLIKM